MIKFPNPQEMSREELERRYAEACSLLDGCFEVVTLWKTSCPSQVTWKQTWLSKARTHGASTF